jgi:hypothetical protein
LGPEHSIAQFYREVSIGWLATDEHASAAVEATKAKRGRIFGRGRG